MTNPFSAQNYVGYASAQAHHIPDFSINLFAASKTISVENQTGIGVYLIDRSNIPLYYPGVEVALEDSFKIFHTYSFTRQTSVHATLAALKNLSMANPRVDLKDAQLIMESLQAIVDRSMTANLARVSVVRKINISEFTKERPRFYLSCIDMVVDHRYDPILSVHPYSTLGSPILKQMQALNQEHSLEILLDLVDNSKSFSTKFLSLGEHILEVKPIQDSSRPDGLYLQASQHDEGNEAKTKIVVDKFYLPQEAQDNKLLAKTREEAIGYSDTVQQRRIALENQKQDLEQERLRLDAEKLKESSRLATLQSDLAVQAAASKAEQEKALHEMRIAFSRQEAELKAAAQEAENRRRLEHEQAMAALAQTKEKARVDSTVHTTEAVKEKAALDVLGLMAKLQHSSVSHQQDFRAAQAQSDIKMTEALAKTLPVVLGAAAAGGVAVALVLSKDSSRFRMSLF